MNMDKNQQVFFELLRAGLWEKDVELRGYGTTDYDEIMRMAEEQSVVGLVTAGLEHVIDVTIPKEILLQFIGSTLLIEQRNKTMNEFVAGLIEKLREENVYSILVKGQGIAQCYECPLWRASGDVDLLLNSENYEKAKKVLVPLAMNVGSEYKSLKHLDMTMPEGFVVELHGTLHSRLSKRVDCVIDKVQHDVFCDGSVRSWQNGNTQVFLPSPGNDVIFVFTHILHHFYIEGVGLRQICDWCRLLWTYKDSLNRGFLESRIRKAGLLSEWKAFAALAVTYLGFPKDSMPLYSDDGKWKKKADRIMAVVLESGNFGHNRYVAEGKVSAVWQKTRDFARHTWIFPWDSIRFFFHFVGNGIGLAFANK